MRQKALGFTLAELLSALAILGVIATFTIPKVLQGQKNREWNAAAKEVMGSMASAMAAHRLSGQLSADTAPADLFDYLNYVRVDTSGSEIDTHQNYTDGTFCIAATPCVRLHNGGVLRTIGNQKLCGTAHTNVVVFMFDPDGKVTDGSPTGDGRSLQFYVGATGKITSRSNVPIPPQVQISTDKGNGFCENINRYNADPTWFIW